MSALIVYESLFGATRRAAEAIATGMREVGHPVDLARADQVSRAAVADADLIIIGAPTHARTLPTLASRKEGMRWPETKEPDLVLDDGAGRPGIREWLSGADLAGKPFAAFSTRASMSRWLTGSATHAIRRSARYAGGHPVGADVAFVALASGELDAGELQRAKDWGHDLGAPLLVTNVER